MHWKGGRYLSPQPQVPASVAFVTDSKPPPPTALATSSNRLPNRPWGRLGGPFPSNASLGGGGLLCTAPLCPPHCSGRSRPAPSPWRRCLPLHDPGPTRRATCSLHGPPGAGVMGVGLPRSCGGGGVRGICRVPSLPKWSALRSSSGDEMGLGKTVQAISYLVHVKHMSGGEADPRPSLVLCPLSLVQTWAEVCALSARPPPAACATRPRDARARSALVRGALTSNSPKC